MDQPQFQAALYVRDPGNNDAISAQLKKLREYAGENGLNPAIEYIDQNGSREAFDRMMTDGTGESPPFQRIVVRKLAQLSRSEEEWTECTLRLEANGVQVGSPEEGCLLPGSFQENIKAAINEYQGHRQSEDIKRGLRHAASQGHYMSPLAPYGFQKVAMEGGGCRHFTLELDPAMSQIVQRIYDTLLNGSSERATAEGLNHDQIPSPNGGPWTPQQVRKIRRNEVNCGTYVYGKKDIDPIRVPGACPAIVSQEKFDQVQWMMEERGRETRNPTA